MRLVTPARASAALLVLTLITGAGNLLATHDQIRASQASQRQQLAALRRERTAIQLKLCTTLGKLAELKAPPGDPATNPSRAFDQEEHATLSQLGTDLGCGHLDAGGEGQVSP
jgi:hypothetical protein